MKTVCGISRPVRSATARAAQLALAIALVLPAPAAATSFTWDFNALVKNKNSTNTALGLDDPIELYMESIFGSDITVRRGAQTRKDKMDGLTSTSLYLGNTDGAPDRGFLPSPFAHPNSKDTFLINRWNQSGLKPHERDRIVITFETVPLEWIAFDWEIFPVVKGSSEPADITFRACTKAERVSDSQGLLNCPADLAHTFFFEDLGPKGSAEKEKGDLGHFPLVGAQFFFPGGPVHQLEWIDWNTAPVGLDNLEGATVVTPEPATILLLTSGLGGLVAWTLRRRRAPASRLRS